MTHYRHDQWVDYTRGLVEASMARPMRRHLEKGCQRCEKTVAALTRVGELAEADAGSRPPKGALRAAKALFAVQLGERPLGWRYLHLRPLEERTLDAAGTRGASGHPATYGAGQLELGLELRPAAASGLVLGGELLDRQRGHLAGVPAFLVSGQEVIDRATTDELGSFQLAGETSRARLCIFLDGDRIVELDLDASADSPGAWTVQPSHRS